MDHTHTAFGARLLRHWVSLLKLSIVLADHIMKSMGLYVLGTLSQNHRHPLSGADEAVLSDCCMLLPCSDSIMPCHGHYLVTRLQPHWACFVGLGSTWSDKAMLGYAFKFCLSSSKQSHRYHVRRLLENEGEMVTSNLRYSTQGDGVTRSNLEFLLQVIHPLLDHGLIAARLDAVTEIAESMGSVGVAQGDGSYPGSGKGGGYVGALSRGQVDSGGKGGRQGLLASLLTSLGKLPDVQRGITRIFLRTATAAEVRIDIGLESSAVV